MSKPLKIFISGPYTAVTQRQIEVNVRMAIHAGWEVMQQGHYPFVPHLNHYIDRHSKMLEMGVFSWDQWMDWCLKWLVGCDALYSIGNSRGADIEYAFALDHGIEVYEYANTIPKLSELPCQD